MNSQRIRTMFTLCGGAALMSVTACGALLGLDEYTETKSGTGGSAGMGGEGQGGQGGQGGQNGECEPGTMTACYEGPNGTLDMGVCKAGTKTCGANRMYGACEGAIVPTIENCAAPADEDCNGTTADCTGGVTWSFSYGSSASFQIGFAVAGMKTGSSVVAGEFPGMVDFGCGSLSTSTSVPNIFLAKLDPQGKCEFSKQFGDSVSYDYGYDVEVGPSDEIILTGGFTSSSINFGGGDLAGQGSNDVYVAKFDSAGNHTWSKRFGDSGDQLAYGAAVDTSGNIFIAGDFGGVIDFGGGALSSSGQKGGFIAKLAPDGTHIFSRSFHVDMDVASYILDTTIASDAAGNTVLVGRFVGTLDVTSKMLTSNGTKNDIFIMKYAPDGTLVYAQSFGSTEDEFNTKVAMGPDGSAYISGKTMGSSLNLTNLGGGTMPTAGGGDAYLIKLNNDGSFADAKVFGDGQEQTVRGLAVDPLGHVILSGFFNGKIDFGGKMLNATPKTLYLAKFDEALQPLWAKAFFSDENESTIFVSADPFANILLTGSFAGKLQIEPAQTLPNAGGNDIFVAKLAP